MYELFLKGLTIFYFSVLFDFPDIFYIIFNLVEFLSIRVWLNIAKTPKT